MEGRIGEKEEKKGDGVKLVLNQVNNFHLQFIVRDNAWAEFPTL